MDKQKISKLIEKLLHRTKENKIEWKASLHISKIYETTFDDYRILVSQGFSGDYFLKIVDNFGTILEEVNDTSMRDDNSSENDLKELYNEAKRSALNANKAIDDILSSLD